MNSPILRASGIHPNHIQMVVYFKLLAGKYETQGSLAAFLRVVVVPEVKVLYVEAEGAVNTFVVRSSPVEGVAVRMEVRGLLAAELPGAVDPLEGFGVHAVPVENIDTLSDGSQ